VGGRVGGRVAVSVGAGEGVDVAVSSALTGTTEVAVCEADNVGVRMSSLAPPRFVICITPNASTATSPSAATVPNPQAHTGLERRAGAGGPPPGNTFVLPRLGIAGTVRL
jgi:hypothetical protein